MKIKAEDWLIDDDFHQQKRKEPKGKGVQIDEDEIKVARQIQTFFKSLLARSISVEDKNKLRNEIELSLKTERKNKIWIRWAATAAMLIFGFSATYLIYTTKLVSPIEHYARNLENQNATDNTILILGDKKEVAIADKDSKISYEPNGKKIQINQHQQVSTINDTTAQAFHSIIVPYGKRSEIVLSDGTKVWLNSGTKLVFPASFDTEEREVYLQGEAIFEVQNHNNSRFFVRTDDFSIKVTGTVFNVTAYSDEEYSSTVLERGHIEIIGERGLLSNQTLKMDPGSMTVYDSKEKSFISSEVNPDDYLSWRDGFLTLHRRKLTNIIKKLSRYYNIDIVLEDESLDDDTFTGLLDLKNSPQEVLEVISRMVPLKVDEKNGKILINSK